MKIMNIVLILPVLFALSCAPKVSTEVLMPAKSSGTSDIKRVVVLPFQGTYGKQMTAAVEGTLVSVRINNQQYFTVLDRTNLTALAKEHKFQLSGIVDTETIVAIGQYMGADGVYIGAASKDLKKESYFEKRTKCGKNSCWDVKVKCLKKTAEILFEPKLIDVSTSEIKYADSISRKTEVARCDDESGETVSDNELIKTAFDQVVDEFRKNIAPYSVVLELEIMTDKSGIENSSGRDLLKRGVEFAEAGRMDRACDLWKEGYSVNVQSVSLAYNTGLCEELAGNYVDALKIYNLADSLTYKPEKVISNALDRVVEMIKNDSELKTQMRN